MNSAADSVVSRARDLLRRGDGAGARSLLDPIAAVDSGSGDVIEGLARAAYLELDFPRSIELWERAYGLYREVGDSLGAMHAARWLGFMYGTFVGDAAVMSGWHGRAKTLAAGAEHTVEAGWVELNAGQFEADPAERRRLLTGAVEIARRFGDTDLEFMALAYLGSALVHDNELDEGMSLLDEACAAVAGHEVDDFCALATIFCQLFAACEHALDFTRAEQWIRIGETVAARRNIPAVTAHCHTHYGALLTAGGRWSEADTALTDAVRIWGLTHNAIRWQAAVRLADLRVRQGRLEEAEQLLDGLDVYTESARPLASIHLARGETARAVDVIERAVETMGPDNAATGPLWALLVDVELSRGDTEQAAKAAERLEALASRHTGSYLPAAAALAKGVVCVATGAGDPRACLHEALSGFSRAQMPMEAARVRLELARALAGESPEVAVAEARAALEAFEGLRAERLADEAAAVLRRLGVAGRTGPKRTGVLTKREAEILELIGHGLSNPEIADRLYISRKTVEHHVGNVLSKLGLRGRAEAAAYAVRGPEKPVVR